jgi:hypothetical protein
VTPIESQATDPDFIGIMPALRRAARRAREIARATHTQIVTWQDGKIKKEYVDSVAEDAPDYGRTRE